MSMAPVLELIELAATRPGGDLLGPVSFAVAPGSCACLVGPSGAGRDDLIDIIAGRTMPRSGRVVLQGIELNPLSAAARLRAGLVRCRCNLVPPPIENLRQWLILSRLMRDGEGLWRRGLMRTDAATQSDLLAVLEFTDLRDQAEWPLERLTINQRRLAQLASALLLRPKLLIVERPFAGLSMAERERWTERLLLLNKDGISLLLLDDCPTWLAQFCQQMTVMAQGRVVASGAPELVGNDPAAIEALTGRPNLP